MTAGTHARVVAQPAFVQVGVVECLKHTNPLLRVQGEHLAQQVDGLMGGGGSEGVEGRHAGRLASLGQHVSLGGLAGVPHVREGGGAQQVGDQVQLLDWRGGLKVIPLV